MLKQPQSLFLRGASFNLMRHCCLEVFGETRMCAQHFDELLLLLGRELIERNFGGHLVPGGMPGVGRRARCNEE